MRWLLRRVDDHALGDTFGLNWWILHDVVPQKGRRREVDGFLRGTRSVVGDGERLHSRHPLPRWALHSVIYLVPVHWRTVGKIVVHESLADSECQLVVMEKDHCRALRVLLDRQNLLEHGINEGLGGGLLIPVRHLDAEWNVGERDNCTDKRLRLIKNRMGARRKGVESVQVRLGFERRTSTVSTFLDEGEGLQVVGLVKLDLVRSKVETLVKNVLQVLNFKKIKPVISRDEGN